MLLVTCCIFHKTLMMSLPLLPKWREHSSDNFLIKAKSTGGAIIITKKLFVSGIIRAISAFFCNIYESGLCISCIKLPAVLSGGLNFYSSSELCGQADSFTITFTRLTLMRPAEITS